MPYSSDAFDELIGTMLKLWNYKRYLDVGCGAGKYGRMIRTLVPGSHIIGIEVDREYIDLFSLNQTYDEVLNDCVQSLLNGPQRVNFELVVLGDVLEHMLKSDGLNVIDFFAYRCKRMIAVYPSKYIQYDVNGKIHESHRSIWGPQDFNHLKCDHSTSGYMNLAIIQGYLDDEDAVYPSGDVR